MTTSIGLGDGPQNRPGTNWMRNDDFDYKL